MTAKAALTFWVAAAAAAVSLLVTGTAAAQTGNVSVTPSTVAAGAPVSISGTVPTSGPAACDPSDTATLTSTSDLFPPDGFGPQLPRDASGAFHTTYSVPAATPPGSYTIAVRCGGGNVGVGATLQVTTQGTTIPTTTPTSTSTSTSAPTSTPAPASGRTGGHSGWVTFVAVVAAALAVLAIATIAVRKGRRRSAT